MNPVSKILFGVGAALVLVIAVAFIWLVLSNAHLKTRLAEAQATSAACRLANENFAESVARQNKAVMALKRAEAARQKRAFQAQKTVQAISHEIEKLRVTEMQGDACKAADVLLDTYIESAQ